MLNYSVYKNLSLVDISKPVSTIKIWIVKHRVSAVFVLIYHLEHYLDEQYLQHVSEFKNALFIQRSAISSFVSHKNKG